MLPSLLAREAAKSMDTAVTMLVTRNILPRVPSSMLNRV